MKTSANPRIGAWIAIAVGVTIALLTSFGAFAQTPLSVERLGSKAGPTVIFIPGLATPGEVFAPYVLGRPDIDAHLMTLPGFAGEPPTGEDRGVITPAAHAIANYLQAEGFEHAVLVGHSLGGQVALQAAGLAPDRVSHVVVVDSLPFFAEMMAPSIDPVIARSRGEAMRDAMAEMERGAFLELIRQGAPVQATSTQHQAQVVEYVAQSDQATVAQATFEALSLDWREGLSAVAAPVTLLVPHNEYIPLSSDAWSARYRAQYDQIKAVDVRVVTDSRHFIMLDQPERFAEEVDRVIGEPT